MALKIAMVGYTNPKGLQINVMLAYGGISERWRSDDNFIAFDAFASAEEYGRGRNSIIDTFNLDISHDEVLEIFSKTGNVGNEISDTVWEIASTRAFIPDWSEVDENNQRVLTLKSLTDLRAQIIEV